MTTVVLDPASPKVQAVFLRMHCRAFARGMVHSKMPVTRLRVLVAKCTGKGPYKAGSYPEMIADLEDVING